MKRSKQNKYKSFISFLMCVFILVQSFLFCYSSDTLAADNEKAEKVYHTNDFAEYDCPLTIASDGSWFKLKFRDNGCYYYVDHSFSGDPGHITRDEVEILNPGNGMIENYNNSGEGRSIDENHYFDGGSEIKVPASIFKKGINLPLYIFVYDSLESMDSKTCIRVFLTVSEAGKVSYLDTDIAEENSRIMKGMQATSKRDRMKMLKSTPHCQSDNKKIKKRVNKLISGKNGDLDKAKAIYDYIVNNISYDYDDYNDINSSKPQDAVTVLNRKKGVCEGYANLLTAMYRAAGIPAINFHGLVDHGYRDSINGFTDSRHAWTLAYINGSWKCFDATWDSNSTENENGRQYNGPDTWVYFGFNVVTHAPRRLFQYAKKDGLLQDSYFLVFENKEEKLKVGESKTLIVSVGPTWAVAGRFTIYVDNLKDTDKLVKIKNTYRGDRSCTNEFKITAKNKGKCQATFSIDLNEDGVYRTEDYKTYQNLDITVEGKPVKCKKLKLDKSVINLRKNEFALIETTVAPKNTTELPQFYSSDTKVAIVTSKGTVMGLKKGKCTITVKAGNQKKKVKVVVK